MRLNHTQDITSLLGEENEINAVKTVRYQKTKNKWFYFNGYSVLKTAGSEAGRLPCHCRFVYRGENLALITSTLC